MSIVALATGVCEGTRYPKPTLEVTYALNTVAVVYTLGKMYKWALRNVHVTVYNQPAKLVPTKLFVPLLAYSAASVWLTWGVGLLLGRGGRYIHGLTVKAE